MVQLLVRLYRPIFARPFFEKWNRLLYRLSLSGLGMLNSRDFQVSGEACFLQDYLSRPSSDGAILDVGANEGGYSLLCANARPSSKIYTFEPHPQTFQRLVENLAGLPVQNHNKAVGRCAGTLELFDYDNKDGSVHASVYQQVIEGVHSGNAISYPVDVVSIDDFVKQEGIEKIALLKIDTEGHELEVLKGAAESIRRGIVGAIQFEFNEMNIVSRIFFKDFVDLLGDYDLYRLLPSGMIKIDYSPYRAEIFVFQNVVAIRRG